MLTLAFETSTLACSVALAKGGDVLAQRESGVNSHSERLLLLVDEVLSECGRVLADVDRIAVGAGPGSFTGLRIGMATAKGLCFAEQKPLYAVSSLAALALDCADAIETSDALVVPILDARRQEIFYGFYSVREGTALPLAPEQVSAPGDLQAALDGVLRSNPSERILLIGDGAELYRDQVGSLGTIVNGARKTPSAGSVARLAAISESSEALAAAAPVYIRLSEAEIKFPDGNPGGSFATETKRSS